MKKKVGRVPLLIMLLVAAAEVLVLRMHQVTTMVDADGVLLSSAVKGPLTWVSIVFVVMCVVCALLHRKGSDVTWKSLPAMIVTLVAAFFLVLSSVVSVFGNWIFGVIGLITAVCWVVVALRRQQGVMPHGLWLMIPALLAAVELVMNFREWSRDPLLMDYCFRLLTAICTMCATFHLSGFSVEQGKRRTCLFFCIAGVIFGTASIVGNSVYGMLAGVAQVLWMLANAWILLGEDQNG